MDQQHETEADLILAAEREAEAAAAAAREPTADEILLAQSDAEWAERDADDDAVMPPPVETAPRPAPAAPAKPLPRPPEVREDSGYGYRPMDKHGVIRGPHYRTRRWMAEEEQRQAEERRTRAERPPLKIRPVAVPGRPTTFIIPERPADLGPREDTVVRSTKRARLTDAEAAARQASMPPAPPPVRALADIPVRYPPPKPGYEVGFYIDKVTGERKADGWPGPVRQANRESV